MLNSSVGNSILANLSREEYHQIFPFLEDTSLKFRKRLQSQNRRIQEVFFIESGIASVVAIGKKRDQSEIAMIGREGMTGLPILLGADRSPCEVFMQVEGRGWSITSEALAEAFRLVPRLQQIALKYAHVFFVQCAHTSLANAQGKLEQRLARWLLMAHDRVSHDDLAITHEFLSLMLGSRRATVTLALHDLQQRHLIATERGSVTVLERDGLEDLANGFYGAAEAEHERLFPLHAGSL